MPALSGGYQAASLAGSLYCRREAAHYKALSMHAEQMMEALVTP